MRIDAMVAAGALCLSTAAMILVAPAAHGDDVLTTITPVTADGVCLLESVGDHLVRCDNLTGGRSAAPRPVPQDGHREKRC